MTAGANVADGNFRLCLNSFLHFTSIQFSVELAIPIFTWFLTLSKSTQCSIDLEDYKWNLINVNKYISQHKKISLSNQVLFQYKACEASVSKRECSLLLQIITWAFLPRTGNYQIHVIDIESGLHFSI